MCVCVYYNLEPYREDNKHKSTHYFSKKKWRGRRVNPLYSYSRCKGSNSGPADRLHFASLKLQEPEGIKVFLFFIVFSALMMEAVIISETSGNFYQTTLHHISEDSYLHVQIILIFLIML